MATTTNAPSTIDNMVAAANLLTGKSGTSTVTNSGGTTTGTTVDSGQTSSTAVNNSGNTVTNSGSTNTTYNSGRTDTSYNSGRTDTQQLMLSEEAVNGLVKKILESTQGLAAVSSGQKASGIYNSTTNSLLTNDLLSRTSAEVAAKAAPLVTKVGDSTTTTNIGPSNSTTNIGGSSTVTGPSTNTSNTVTGQRVINTTSTAPQTTAATNTIQNPQINPGKAIGALGAAQLVSSAANSPLVKTALNNLTGTAADSGLTAATVDSGVGALDVTGSYSSDIGAAMGTNTGGAFDLGSGLSGVQYSDLAAPSAEQASLYSAASAEQVPIYTAGSGIATDAAVSTGIAALSSTGAAAAADLAAFEAGSTAVELGTAAEVGATAAEGASLGELAAAVVAWIVCTELNRQGRLPSRFYKYGAREFAKYDEKGKRGYYIWAVPSVAHLRKHPNSLYSKFLCWLFNHRAEYLAAKAGCRTARKTELGEVITYSTYAFCWILSRTIARNYKVNLPFTNRLKA